MLNTPTLRPHSALQAPRQHSPARQALIALALWLCIGLAMAPAHALDTPNKTIVAGHVTFLSGQAHTQHSTRGQRALQNGAPVYVGDQIHTPADTHLHLRMVDNAFVALRPSSQLTIEIYDYNATRPEASRIRMDLQHGTTRAVSGQGGQAAKHQYRFNTPLAAIGLRGTDYTVIADADKTRVSVVQGGVIVSPFHSGCTNTQLGPCLSALSRELTAGMPIAYLEVRASQTPGVRSVPSEPNGNGNGDKGSSNNSDKGSTSSNSTISSSDKGSSDSGSSDNTTRNSTNASSTNASSTNASSTNASSTNASGTATASNNEPSTSLNDQSLTADSLKAKLHLTTVIDSHDNATAAITKPAVLAPSEPASVTPTPDLSLTETPVPSVPLIANASGDTPVLARWGRWQSMVQQQPQGSGSINQVMGAMGAFTLAGSNSVFAIAHPSSANTLLPKDGRVNFSLVAAEAYLLQQGQISPAQVQNGTLQMDFAQNSFATQLSVQTQPGQTHQLQAQGTVDAYGRIKSAASPAANAARIQGIVLNQGLEATYLFDQALSPSASITGAAQWGR